MKKPMLWQQVVLVAALLFLSCPLAWALGGGEHDLINKINQYQRMAVRVTNAVVVLVGSYGGFQVYAAYQEGNPGAKKLLFNYLVGLMIAASINLIIRVFISGSGGGLW